MGKVVVFKPADVGIKDNYQSSVGTNYVRDQTTGQLFKTSGDNVRMFMQEQFKTAQIYGGVIVIDATANPISQIYDTIPEGKIVILSEMNIQAWNLSGSGTQKRYHVEIEDPNENIMEVMDGFAYIGGNVTQDKLEFPNSLCLDSKSKIHVSCGIGTYVFFRTFGWIVDKSEFPTLKINDIRI